MITKIRGIRQGVPGGTYLGRANGKRGAVVDLPFPNTANGTTAGGGQIAQSSVGAAGVSFSSQGAWNAALGYLPGDVVTYHGSAYVNYVSVAAPGPNTAPSADTTHWASQGNINTVDSNFVVSSGQLQLSQIASGAVLGNSTGGLAEPVPTALNALLDLVFGSTPGQAIRRGTSVWQALTTATSATGLANPTGTASTTSVMMGLAGSITPTFSGKLLIIATGNVQNTAAVVSVGQIAYGTGSAPANAAAATGTTAGSYVQASGPNQVPYTLIAIVTGLTVGTAYWLDMQLRSQAGGTASIFGCSMLAMEL